MSETLKACRHSRINTDGTCVVCGEQTEPSIESLRAEVERLKTIVNARTIGVNTLKEENTQLLAECAAVKGVLQYVHDEIEPMAAQILSPKDNTFSRIVAKVDAALSTPTGKELLEDKARLDWLDENMIGSVGPARETDEEHPVHRHFFCDMPVFEPEQGGLRAAIDAARSREGVRG